VGGEKKRAKNRERNKQRPISTPQDTEVVTANAHCRQDIANFTVNKLAIAEGGERQGGTRKRTTAERMSGNNTRARKEEQKQRTEGQAKKPTE
jgi:hypothetical protein